MSVNKIDINAVNERTLSIKPVCVCESCGADVVPSKAEAGKFLIQFRTKTATKKQLSAAGKKGASKRWPNSNIKI